MRTPRTAAGRDDCIETNWTRDKKGYGMANRGGKRWRAHRYAWTLVNGPIPEGMLVCHHCDNPPCVNTAHLFLGTPADNMADRDAKGHTATGDRNGSRLHPERRPRGKRMSYPQPGETNGRAKLTAEQVAYIRAGAWDRSGRSFAKEFGVHPSTVQRIISGRRWNV